MVKRLNDLIVIRETSVVGSNETIFTRESDKSPIPKENLDILKQAPVLLFETYGELFMAQRHTVPEEANAVLVGQEAVIPGRAGTKIYSANYSVLKK